jgi:hypothetical protein
MSNNVNSLESLGVSVIHNTPLSSGTKDNPALEYRDNILDVLQKCSVEKPQKIFNTLKTGLREAGDAVEQELYSSMAPLLPLMLTLKGNPYTLRNHFMMEAAFKTIRPWEMIFKCGRQISKSTTLAAQSIIQTSMIPYFNTLFVLPQFEMTKRFSNNYVKAMIDDSPVKHLLQDSTCENNILQRTFLNRSIQFYTHCFGGDATRIRGIATDLISCDEIQNIDWDVIPVIAETVSASDWGIKQYSGTPLSFDNTIQALWGDSSQAEWCVRCGCGHWNIPCQGFDIHDMIGPTTNIAKYGTAIICAKCGKPLDIRTGGWVHQYPDRYSSFCGYHVPQIILPHHYSDEKNWETFLKKRDSGDTAKYLNECLGESCDVGLKLITTEEIKAAAILHPNVFQTARDLPLIKKYIQVVLGVDWGGGGEDEKSFTTLAIVGVTPDNRYETIYLERLHIATGDIEEVQRIIEVFHAFKCQYLAHDFAGAGSVHETLLLQAGFPAMKIIPFNYMHVTAKPMITVHNADNDARHYYVLDKARSVLLLTSMLKTKHLLLPKYDSCTSLLEDFLHIYKETHDAPHRGSMLLVKRVPKKADDIVHAINFACCAHYHTTQHYPELATSFGVSITQEQMDALDPEDGDYLS